MITGRELTPEERQKVFRSQRFQAVSFLLFGASFLILCAVALLRGHRDTYDYIMSVLGLAYFAVAALAWSRARKYR
jgi:hypothetical protein